jgi:deoxyribodipyrimidine photo-lyase
MSHLQPEEDFKAYDIAPYLDKFKTLSTKLKIVHELSDIDFSPSTIPAPTIRLNNSIIDHYEDTRNFPSVPGTSQLGTSLRFGTVCIRQLARKAYQSANHTFLSELIWREFFQQILWHFPKTVNYSFKPAYDRIEWRNAPEDFERWKKGKTGYALVDAGMRELNATGYMHNRVRMLVASFLCKHLLIDWRLGEAYFAEKLFDFELASNVGNWQWAAGSGVDAAPYFRIFNPITQAKKFDADLKYIRKWVPEFESTHYQPMVDHKFARERCLSTYKQALNS